MQSYQRFQHVGHTAFNTSGTNGPRSLSRAKVGTHSAFGEGSHTRAHTPKHGVFWVGALSLPSDCFTRFGNPAWPGVRTAYFAAFGSWPGVLRRTQRASGQRCAYARRCSAGVAAPLGCVIFFASAEVAACTPCAQCFPNVRDEGWYHYPRRALCAVETLGARLSK